VAHYNHERLREAIGNAAEEQDSGTESRDAA
jgi:hypothetical protein